MALEPYVPISELAAPQTLLDAVETVVNNNIVIAQNVLNFRDAALADEAITAEKLDLVINPLLLGGA
jgi:hypothetical protein